MSEDKAAGVLAITTEQGSNCVLYGRPGSGSDRNSRLLSQVRVDGVSYQIGLIKRGIRESSIEGTSRRCPVVCGERHVATKLERVIASNPRNIVNKIVDRCSAGKALS